VVKDVDEKSETLLDHVGWRLWQANRRWQRDFAEAMRAAGHDWFSESRAALLGNIPRAGLAQSALIERAGISKQAVQQLLDGLERDGVVERCPDPDDRRGKLIRFTPKGIRALADGDHIKLAIEESYRARIGEKALGDLMAALRLLDGT